MRKAFETEALVVRTVAYGEADLIVTYVTRAHGRLSALLRGARTSKRRDRAAHEPFHTVFLAGEDRGGDLVSVREARVVQVRVGIQASLPALEAGGLALRWLRHAVQARHPEPGAWGTTLELLDALDAGPAEPRVPLATAGLRLLADVGYGLELVRCVVCGRACPEDRPACVDPGRGGLVCRACGGARLVLSPATRRVARAAQAGEPATPSPDQADAILAIVEAAMAAHGDFDPR